MNEHVQLILEGMGLNFIQVNEDPSIEVIPWGNSVNTV